MLLDMLDGDDLVDLFREIVTEDFGPDAACEMFGEDDLAGRSGTWLLRTPTWAFCSRSAECSSVIST